jgi:hypothetical protein
MEQLTKQRNDQCTIGLNFETRRPRRDILADYKKVIERIYDADAYFARVLRVARKLNRFWPPKPPSAFTIYGIPLRDVMKLFSACRADDPAAAAAAWAASPVRFAPVPGKIPDRFTWLR